MNGRQEPEDSNAEVVVRLVRIAKNIAVRHYRDDACRGVPFEDCENCGGLDLYGVLCKYLTPADAALAELECSEAV